MKTWIVEYSQNGWEYTGILKIQANSIIKQFDKWGCCQVLIVDGAKLTFDEDVETVKEVKL